LLCLKLKFRVSLNQFRPVLVVSASPAALNTVLKFSYLYMLCTQLWTDFSYFNFDYLTCGVSVTGLARVYLLHEGWKWIMVTGEAKHHQVHFKTSKIHSS
jgi:hypothetical protein